MTIELSRRGFLGGIIAACAAPAIVSSGILMPVKPSLIVEPAKLIVRANTLLTPTMITREALRIFHSKVNYLTSVGTAGQQTHIDLNIPTHDLTLSLDTFSNRYLRPAMGALARYAVDVGPAPPVPRGVVAGVSEELNGMGLRYLVDYDIHNDKVVHRFDIRNL